MNIELTATFKVLGKCEPKERKDGSFFYQIKVDQKDECGKISVPQEIYERVKVGEDNVLFGVQTTFDGNTYISWKELIPFPDVKTKDK